MVVVGSLDTLTKASKRIPPLPDVTIIEIDLRQYQQENLQNNANVFFNRGKIARPVLPDHTLYNIGLDAAPTDLVCVSPPGMLFYPNDALSFQRQLTVTGSGSRWGGLESKLAIAIIIPAYLDKSVLSNIELKMELNSQSKIRQLYSINNQNAENNNYNENNLNNLNEIDNSTAYKMLPDLVAYPPIGSFCGDQQSMLLKHLFAASMNRSSVTNADDLPTVDFDAQVPIVFCVVLLSRRLFLKSYVFCSLNSF